MDEERRRFVRDPRLWINAGAITDQLADLADGVVHEVRHGLTENGEWYWSVDNFERASTIVLGIEEHLLLSEHARDILRLLEQEPMISALMLRDLIIRQSPQNRLVLEPWDNAPHEEKWFSAPDGTNCVAFLQHSRGVTLGETSSTSQPSRPVLSIRAKEWAAATEEDPRPALHYSDAMLIAIAHRAGAPIGPETLDA